MNIFGTLPRAIWIDRFVMQMSRHGVRGQPHHVTEYAHEIWRTCGHLDPEEVARIEADAWPVY